MLYEALLISSPKVLIPYRFLQGSLVPQSLVRVGDAARSFKSHMVEMLEQETNALRQNNAGSGGILSGLVRALDVHQREHATDSDVKKGLSVQEILGNLFVINFAGYDTSAAALAFSLHLLAVHPEVQTWLAEEIVAVSGDQVTEEWDYKAMFPCLKRCQAILLETLRLYPPIVAVPKWTGTTTQTLDVGHQTLTIPPGVYTAPHLIAIHTHPKYWNEPYTWKPSRWISSEPPPAPHQASSPGPNPLEMEKVVEPAPNTYFPWSDGPQNCPGKKFIQVEAVAVLACLFKSHRLSVQAKAGESAQAARKRVVTCVNTVNMEVILRMEYTKELKLVCTEA